MMRRPTRFDGNDGKPLGWPSPGSGFWRGVFNILATIAAVAVVIGLMFWGGQ